MYVLNLGFYPFIINLSGYPGIPCPPSTRGTEAGYMGGRGGVQVCYTE